MKVYRWIWSAIACLAVLLGLVLATAESLIGCLILFIITALFVGPLSVNVRAGDFDTPTKSFWRKVGSDVGGAGVLVVTTYGLGVSRGAGVLLILVAMVITSPPLVARASHWLNGTEPEPVEAPTDTDTMPGSEHRPEAADTVQQEALEQWSTESLCHEWCRTSLQLLRVTEPQATATIAAGRARLLDELERRDPAGLTNWLESGAQPFSDPRRFVRES